MRQSLLLLLVTAALPRSSMLAQPHSGSATDPVFAKITALHPLYKDPATRRLEVLTEIWGNVGLYHPVPSAEHLKWDDLLIEAIRELPSVHTERQFANLLNRVIFAPLHDPLLYAATRTEQDSTYHFPPALETHALAPGVAYVSAVDRAYWQRGSVTTLFGPRDFVTPLRRVIDSLASGGNLKRLVIDLRSSSVTSYRPGLPATWLGMWLPHPVRTAQQISVLRTTSEGMGQVQWLLSPRDLLPPDGEAVSIPTVFIVNRTSYASVERALDAVRSSRRDVAVVFEAGGPIPNLGYNGFQVLYPDSILLPHFHDIRLSADGALGTVVDVTAAPGLAIADLDTLSDRALSARSMESTRAPFAFEDAAVVDDKPSTNPLSREQRIAGLMKIWFWVGRFYAYPDDITGDWRRLPAEWLPRIEAAADDRAYYLLLRRISASLNDTHAGVRHPLSISFSPMTTFVPPVYLAYVEGRVAVMRADTSNAALDIHPGDEVTAIEGKPINDVKRANYPYWSVSKANHNAPIRSFIGGPKNSLITLTLRTLHGTHDVTLPRSRIFGSVYGQIYPGKPLFAISPDNIGYMNLAALDSKEKFDSAMTALENTRGLILDDRSALAAEAELDWGRFVVDPDAWMLRVESISAAHDEYSPTLGFGISEAWDVPKLRSVQPKYSNPIVLMISNDNISHGETLAILFRNARRGLLVGEATNGTTGSQEGVTIPGGAYFTFSTGRGLFPDGKKYHGIGVQPDIPAAPTLRGLRAGRDEVYEKATETLSALLVQQAMRGAQTQGKRR